MGMGRTRLVLWSFLMAWFAFAGNAQAGVGEAGTYLTNNQNSDGSWGVDSSTQYFETTEAVRSLQSIGNKGNAYAEGLNFIANSYIDGTEDRARRVEALFPEGYDVTDDISEILEAQRADGSFGFAVGYEGNVFHTALALAALKASGTGGAANITAISYLLSFQNADGSFGLTADQTSVYLTSLVGLALDGLGQDAVVDAAIAWLVSRQNPDGGFGDSGSTTFETAFVSRLLYVRDNSSAVAIAAQDYLLDNQNINGSFNDETYDTAVAAWGLKVAFIDAPLKSGLNLFGLPSGVEVGYTSYNLIEDLGGELVVDRVDQFNRVTGLFESTFYSAGVVSGDEFPIVDDEGYLVYMKDAGVMYHRVQAFTSSYQFTSGLNVVAFSNAPTEPAITSQDLLGYIGSPAEVASVQRINRETGRFETTVYQGSLPVGASFDISIGEAYLVHMLVAKDISNIFDPPSISITSPVDGTEYFDPLLDVTGTVSVDVMSVFVNDVPANIVGSTFSADDIVLVEGVNAITAVATGSNGITASNTINITYIEGIDYTIPQGGSANDSQSVFGDPALLSGAAGVGASWTGPTFFGLAIAGASFVAANEIQISYQIQIAASAPVGVYDFHLELSVSDSAGEPLVPLTNNIYDFKVRVTTP